LIGDGALLIGDGALLIGDGALLIGDGALLIRYGALLIGYGALLIGYGALFEPQREGENDGVALSSLNLAPSESLCVSVEKERKKQRKWS